MSVVRLRGGGSVNTEDLGIPFGCEGCAVVGRALARAGLEPAQEQHAPWSVVVRRSYLQELGGDAELCKKSEWEEWVRVIHECNYKVISVYPVYPHTRWPLVAVEYTA